VPQIVLYYYSAHVLNNNTTSSFVYFTHFTHFSYCSLILSVSVHCQGEVWWAIALLTVFVLAQHMIIVSSEAWQALVSLMVFAWVLGGGTRLVTCATFVLDKVALGLDPLLVLFTRDAITQDCQCVWVMSYARPDFHYSHLLDTLTQTWRNLKALILTWSRGLVYPPSQKCYSRISCLSRLQPPVLVSTRPLFLRDTTIDGTTGRLFGSYVCSCQASKLMWKWL